MMQETLMSNFRNPCQVKEKGESTRKLTNIKF